MSAKKTKINIPVSKLEDQMDAVLNSLGLKGWASVWIPGDGSKRGAVLLDKRLIAIYDKTPREAWDTFQHELIELRLRRVMRPYRILCNKLIEAVEKVTYREKEEFIDELPEILRTIEGYKEGLKELGPEPEKP